MDNTARHDPGNGDKSRFFPLGNASGKDIHGINARRQVENNGGNDKSCIILDTKHVNHSFMDADRRRYSQIGTDNLRPVLKIYILPSP